MFLKRYLIKLNFIFRQVGNFPKENLLNLGEPWLLFNLCFVSVVEKQETNCSVSSLELRSNLHDFIFSHSMEQRSDEDREAFHLY